MKIKEVEDDRVIILASGMDPTKSGRYLVGILIPDPARNEKRIQPPEPDKEPACCLLELGPVYSPISRELTVLCLD
jgi:hypothetical protein